MNLVVLESPYMGSVERHTVYAREAITHSLDLGEAPFASHLLYTQVYDDNIPHLREAGITAGHAWLRRANTSALYCDLGYSPGMKQGLQAAIHAGVTVVARWIRGPVPTADALATLFGSDVGYIAEFASYTPLKSYSL